MRNSTKIEKEARPRGRPRGFITSEVLERVRDVFLAKGFAAASLDELCAAAGLNRPSLYAAFGDKEQLYIAMLRHIGQKSVEAMDAILSTPDPIEQRLGRLYKGAIDIYTRPPTPPGCIIVGTATVESPSHPEIGAAANRILADFEKAFERGFVESSLKPTPSPAERASMAGAILYATGIRARLGVPASELRAFTRSMIPLICR
jgi:AcrR family transcriptional regulator